MTDPPASPLADLQALAARAAALDDDRALQERVRHNLEASFGPLDTLRLGAPSAAATAAAGASVSKALLTKAVLGSLLVGTVVGGSLVELRHRAEPVRDASPVIITTPPPPAPVSPVSPIAPSPPAADPPLAAQPVPPAAPARRPSPPRPTAMPADAPTTTTAAPVRYDVDDAPDAPDAPDAADGPDALDAERLLIERGKTALARRDFAAVQAAVQAHRRRHPAGAFAEERDALEAIALLRAGDPAGRAAAAAFAERYPKSPYLEPIRAAAPAFLP